MCTTIWSECIKQTIHRVVVQEDTLETKHPKKKAVVQLRVSDPRGTKAWVRYVTWQQQKHMPLGQPSSSYDTRASDATLFEISPTTQSTLVLETRGSSKVRLISNEVAFEARVPEHEYGYSGHLILLLLAGIPHPGLGATGVGNSQLHHRLLLLLLRLRYLDVLQKSNGTNWFEIQEHSARGCTSNIACLRRGSR